MTPDWPPLLERARDGDFRALGRLCSLLEEGGPNATALMGAIDPAGGQALRIGITGPPGAGKSTLLRLAISHFRAINDGAVAVVAVDPSSPRTGGALLGDRLRWAGHQTDPHVFIRSMASRGSLGGLAHATRDVVGLLDGLGYPTILVETVGLGQVGADIAEAVDLVVVVLVPESGDAVQMLKAGMLELADCYVINKADRPGADALADTLRGALELSEQVHEGRTPPAIIPTIATDGTGLEALWTALAGLAREHRDTGALEERRRAQRVRAVESLALRALGERAAVQLRSQDGLKAGLEAVGERLLSPHALAEELVRAVAPDLP